MIVLTWLPSARAAPGAFADVILLFSEPENPRVEVYQSIFFRFLGKFLEDDLDTATLSTRGTWSFCGCHIRVKSSWQPPGRDY